jgi:glyoxylase-like metal-dependent hydrolase (beta-lactamase superfamily II)
MEEELIIEQIACGPMQNFVYLIGSKKTREVALVDPAWTIDPLLEHVQEQDFTPVAALVTHYHPDHIGGEIYGQRIEGLSELLARKGMKIYANKLEADGVKQVTGVSDSDMVKVDTGDTLRIGEIEIEFLHTPGHTPGSQCFRIQSSLVSGDTLFIQGCGRVDLPGADSEQMYHSLRQLNELPDETLLLPGHDYGGGSSRTMGETKKMNPYLQIDSLERWRLLMGA